MLGGQGPNARHWREELLLKWWQTIVRALGCKVCVVLIDVRDERVFGLLWDGRERHGRVLLLTPVIRRSSLSWPSSVYSRIYNTSYKVQDRAAMLEWVNRSACMSSPQIRYKYHG